MTTMRAPRTPSYLANASAHVPSKCRCGLKRIRHLFYTIIYFDLVETLRPWGAGPLVDEGDDPGSDTDVVGDQNA
jgi:hypothetical protein